MDLSMRSLMLRLHSPLSHDAGQKLSIDFAENKAVAAGYIFGRMENETQGSKRSSRALCQSVSWAYTASAVSNSLVFTCRANAW